MEVKEHTNELTRHAFIRAYNLALILAYNATRARELMLLRASV